MNLRALAIVAAVAVVALAVALWPGESEDEARLRQVIAALVAAFEAGDGEAFASHVAADYTDRLGHDDRSIVRRAMAERAEYDDLRVELTGLELDVDAAAGFATASFRPTFESSSGPAPAEEDRYGRPAGRRFQARFRRHGPRWLVIRGDVVYSLRDAL